MDNSPGRSRWVLWLSIPFATLLTVVTLLAIRTSGFGYFITPTPTITPTSTISFYNENQREKATPTPFQPLPTITSTPTATPTNTPTATSTPWPTNTPIPIPTSLPLPTNAPDGGQTGSVKISGVVSHPQTYNLSCEARSAVDWAAFYGVSISEDDFQSGLPLSDNPDKGFVGNVNGSWGYIPPNDYGVHAGPVAALLREYGVSATGTKGISLKSLREQIDAGNPVIVWVVGNVWEGAPTSYTASDGTTTTVAYLEHSVILVGYNETGYYFVDGGYSYWRSAESFEISFGALNNMAVIRP